MNPGTDGMAGVPAEAAAAVRNLLAAAEVPADLDRDSLLEQLLSAQAALRAARAEADAASAQASTAAGDADVLSRALICPITQAALEDPVICTDGHTYERAAIERWFSGGRMTSPVTNQRLRDRTLIPNHALRSAIAMLHERGDAAAA